jgi:branched-chain amino acid transport system substrate-binding protein
VCSCTGVEADSFPDSLNVYQAWENWTNAHGGINGYHVKLIAMDDALNPTTSVAEVKTLVQQDHVVAIVGENSLTDAAWASYVQQQGIPVIGGLTTDAAMNANPDFFPTGTGTTNLTAATFAVMQQHNLTHYGVMYCAEAQTCATLVSLAQNEVPIIDKSITVTGAKIAKTQPNYDAPCLSMKGGSVDSLAIGESSDIVSRVVDQCAQLGYKPTIVNQLTTFSQTLPQDSNFNGSYWVSPDANFLDTAAPGVATYHAALQQYVPQLLTNPQYDVNEMWEWAGGQVFAKAAALAHLTPSSTPADLKAGLYQVKNDTLGGLTPPLTYTKGQPTNPAGYYVMQIQGGKMVGSTLETFTPAQAAALDKIAFNL